MTDAPTVWHPASKSHARPRQLDVTRPMRQIRTFRHTAVVHSYAELGEATGSARNSKPRQELRGGETQGFVLDMYQADEVSAGDHSARPDSPFYPNRHKPPESVFFELLISKAGRHPPAVVLCPDERHASAT